MFQRFKECFFRVVGFHGAVSISKVLVFFCFSNWTWALHSSYLPWDMPKRRIKVKYMHVISWFFAFHLPPSLPQVIWQGYWWVYMGVWWSWSPNDTSRIKRIHSITADTYHTVESERDLHAKSECWVSFGKSIKNYFGIIILGAIFKNAFRQDFLNRRLLPLYQCILLYYFCSFSVGKSLIMQHCLSTVCFP